MVHAGRSDEAGRVRRHSDWHDADAGGRGVLDASADSARTVNVIYGAWSAMGQTDLKYVIGYSSVSHMGYVIMGIATLHALGLNGAVLQMFSHGVMTALFFAAVGVIYEKTHTRDIGTLNGLAKRDSPWDSPRRYSQSRGWPRWDCPG